MDSAESKDAIVLCPVCDGLRNRSVIKLQGSATAKGARLRDALKANALSRCYNPKMSPDPASKAGPHRVEAVDETSTSQSSKSTLLPSDTRQYSPSIPPVTISTILRHTSDPNRRRATFQVQYPSYEIVLEKKADLTDKLPPRFENGRRTINAIRFYVKATDLLITESDFTQCKFHRFIENGDSRMAGTTFIGCNFEKCIFGGTVYRHVRFERCSFRRCDFGMSQFIDCQFKLCNFTECTGEHVSFSATEINPSALLAGMAPPHYNYDSEYEGELSPTELARQWLEIRRALAAQLVKSNGEIHHTVHCDCALVELKTAELNVRLDLLRSRPLRAGVISSFVEAVRCGVFWLVLGLTNGGTSVARLVVIAFLAVPAYATLLSMSSVTFQGKPCHLASFELAPVINQLACAASLFLAIGYTAFVGNNVLELVLLTVGAGLGLIWYALLAAVVIRRVYR